LPEQRFGPGQVAVDARRFAQAIQAEVGCPARPALLSKGKAFGEDRQRLVQVGASPGHRQAAKEEGDGQAAGIAELAPERQTLVQQSDRLRAISAQDGEIPACRQRSRPAKCSAPNGGQPQEVGEPVRPFT
jgi:hypothetical protein